MNPPLLIPTISLFVALPMSGILLIIAQLPQKLRGLREWGVAALAIALRSPLFIAQGLIPGLLKSAREGSSGL